MNYADGCPGGFDPHARVKDLDLDGIDAAFLYPSIGLFSGALRACVTFAAGPYGGGRSSVLRTLPTRPGPGLGFTCANACARVRFRRPARFSESC